MEAHFLVYSTCSGVSGDRPPGYGEKYPTNADWCRRVLARTGATRTNWPLAFAVRSACAPSLASGPAPTSLPVAAPVARAPCPWRARPSPPPPGQQEEEKAEQGSTGARPA